LRPYIEADTLFTRVRGQPLPRHILEPSFLENKSGTLDHPYWNEQFVGLGPFKVREWVSGSHAVLAANDRYILGRPKLDEIEVRFIPDQNTLVANVLAGAVELNLGRSLSVEQAVQVRDQWRTGGMEVGALTSWIGIYPQFINPSPPVTGLLPFRRALYHAVDRQQMAEELMLGLVPVAHSLIAPGDSEHAAVEPSVIRYDFDPRRATQILEGLGFSRGPDGLLRDSANQPLTVHTQTSQGNNLQEKSMFAVGEYWRRIGLTVQPDVVAAQARTDRAYRAARPGFEVQKQPKGVDALIRYHSAQTPLPENNFVGNNRSRYQSAEFDAHLDRYFSTIPRDERMAALGRVVQHMTENLNAFGLIFDADPLMMGQRLQNVAAPGAQGPTVAWNAHDWDIRS
jgi:peptide/nickel transport system substrate-binding protein